MRVAIATCAAPPEADPDEPLLLSALGAAGIEARALAWDDPAAPFAEHDLVVVRSTWNYHHHLAAFLTWTRSVAATTRLLNPADVIAWNTTKTYLGDLEGRGVPVVPTELVAQGAPCELTPLLERRGWDTVVIKPIVSAGSFRTERFTRQDRGQAQAFLDALTQGRGAMIQPWMPSVEGYGERSLVWIDGELTHAVRKAPRFAQTPESTSGEAPIADDERALAEQVLSVIDADLLYARVDVVRDPAGVPRVMEVELVEPSLFFAQSERALARMTVAIARRLR
jgi:hypothetical protein